MHVAHNQMQFQNIYMAAGLKLNKTTSGFAMVNYYPGKEVVIYNSNQSETLWLPKDKGESETVFVCRAVKAWNNGERN